ncbi:MAG: hypothetical protein A3F31_01590 [Candidatus Levybacteria bacterium RIFCSPHIGHO2_12_FULL_38_12]|nr:MAG: hypothetical protein A2770_01170 [Candidatus Levybacteria bacterium RIFCSPHIGHO2_01_FULL_38_12]OGH22901.1 MAG: hypothetical protein A3F31_01590 [Candidatus Levybacteria bacterium RIFCSPHIGHO2_12_FULL_38_12]OGH34017.1 MAG: hypothetical protein A3A47_04830 [Candidatus Levybacteria bacterium RIFCSPLOWO2_01_FULL_37_20]OGH44825.1 MAG: hypothetical protein A3J14_05365 [Candidatus Levybacteria bacterium RIFCSPLOWO2_02_FULL_37_18]
MKLSYSAKTIDGKKIEGVIEAKDKTQAASYLKSQKIYPVKITVLREKEIIRLLPFLQDVKFSDLVFFTRQLSSILVSGLTLMEALRILKEQTANRVMREVISDLITEIEDGKPLSSAIAKHPEVFSSIYVSLMKAAETSGLLDKVLLRLSENLEKQQKLQSEVRGALLYPIIVVIMMVVVFIIMMVLVVPQLAGLYKNLNVELPFITKAIIEISNFFLFGWPIILGLSFLLYISYFRWVHTESGRLVRDGFLLELPVFGKILKQTTLAEFARTFGLMVGAGTSIVESLTKTADTASNVLYKNAIIQISHQVERGVQVGEAMGASPLFPPVLVQMAKIGEETGKLDESLMKVSEYFEREVDELVHTLTTALEPFILIILGIGIAFLIFGIITPIYGLLSAVK